MTERQSDEAQQDAVAPEFSGEDLRPPRRLWFLIILALALLALFVLSFNIGRYPVGPNELVNVLWHRLTNTPWEGDPAIEHVVFNIRLPRITLAILIGASLSVAGCVYQGMFRNPLVSPDILGASSGAGFGASLAITLGLTAAGIQSFAFLAGLLAIMLAWFASRAMRRDAILGLVLAGMVISAIFSAGTSFLQYTADPDKELPAITFWLMGSLNGVRKGDILIVLVPCLVCTVVLWLNSWKLNVVAFGDDTAKSLGINVGRTRSVVIVGATLLTTTSVAVGGLISWVGLVVPHLARMTIGPDMRRLLPASFLLGGIFLVVVDNLARSLLQMEIPIGILTAVVGAPFLLGLIMSNREW